VISIEANIIIVNPGVSNRGKRPVSRSQHAQAKKNKKRRLNGQGVSDNESDFEDVEIECLKRSKVLQLSNHNSRGGSMSYHIDLSH
jgi:hypothetical protein